MRLKFFACRLAVALAACCTLSGCFVLNSVRTLPSGGTPSSERSVLVYGIQAEGQWRAPRWAVGLDEFDMARQQITGNCWHYNRTKASIPSESRDIHFFAFDAPQGYYALSGFSALSGEILTGKVREAATASTATREAPVAFFAPGGRTVLVGVYVYTPAGNIVLRRDLAAQLPLIKAQLPRVTDEVVLAESVALSQAPGMFLCTP